MIPWDVFASEHGISKVNFMKIDVEGWECKVLKVLLRCLFRLMLLLYWWNLMMRRYLLLEQVVQSYMIF